MLERLEELAKDAEQMPWEHSPADVPYSARQAFRDGCDPSTILRLVRVARAAKALVIRNQCDSLAHAMLCDDVYPLLDDLESAVLGLGKP
jgi:hypothetical protein